MYQDLNLGFVIQCTILNKVLIRKQTLHCNSVVRQTRHSHDQWPVL
jgi:hypothetical protein